MCPSGLNATPLTARLWSRTVVGLPREYAARHPDRVTHLILYGAYARGRRWRGVEERAHGEAMISAIRAGWTEATPTFRHLFSMLFLPHGTAEQMAWYDELQRRSTSAETAVRLYDARNDIDVLDRACEVTTPTLVLHARDDRVVPVEEGRLLAARVPGARFVMLDSANHILLADEPAWQDFLVELDSFLPAVPSPPPDTSLAELSARELDVLELVAGGLTNEAIADRLCLSVRTVERHLSNIYVKLRVSGKGRTRSRGGAVLPVPTCKPPREFRRSACWRGCPDPRPSVASSRTRRHP